jgi:pimeloyl-ACP methyl ester carboxylesterase
MTKFYRRKRFWIPLLLLVLLVTPFILSPLNSFRVTTTCLLRVFGIEEKTLRADRYRFHFYEGGEDHGKTVILLHGFGGNALLTWMQLMPALARNYRVVAPDLLASNILALNPTWYSIDTEVQLVLKLMDTLRIERASFVGLSVGGWVSLLIALEHPERVEKLILVESAGIRTEVPELAGLVLTNRETAGRFMKLLFHNPPPLPGFVLDALVKSSQKIKPRYMKNFYGFLKNSEGRLLDGRLGEIQKPTLILHGRNDQVIPLQVGEKLHEGLPNSELVILEDSGHAAVWDSPQQLKKNILEFLGRND